MNFTDLTHLFISGAGGTIKLFLIGLVGALVLGTILAVMRVSPTPMLRGISATYVTVVRNTPLTLVMFFCAFGLPYLSIRYSDDSALNSLAYAGLALALYSACFVAETLRSGIGAIPKGQTEAARAIGLPFGLVLRLVVFPQAIRTVIPPMGSVVIAILKNCAIASAFNNKELVSAMRTAVEFRGDLLIPILLATAAVYLLLALILGRVFALLERKAVLAR